MSLNVYRAKELIYFDDKPQEFQGYYVSTSSDSFTSTFNAFTWEVCEAEMRRLFPGECAITLSGLVMAAFQGDDGNRQWAIEQLETFCKTEGQQDWFDDCGYDDVISLIADKDQA